MNITSPSPKKDFLLGLVFFGGIGALLYSTVVLTGFTLDTRPVLEVRFADAAGLREGDAVLVSGRHAGSVLAVRWLPDEAPDRRIGVDLELEGPLILHQDYRIRISEFTLLGGRVVEINPGLPSSPSIPSGSVLSGQMGISTLAALGELVAENRDAVDEIVENLRLASRGLARGDGILGSLLHDPEMLRDLEGILESTRAIGEDIREGKGALGLLASDATVREQLVSLLSDGAAAMTDLALIAEDLSEGRAGQSTREDHPGSARFSESAGLECPFDFSPRRAITDHDQSPVPLAEQRDHSGEHTVGLELVVGQVEGLETNERGKVGQRDNVVPEGAQRTQPAVEYDGCI